MNMKKIVCSCLVLLSVCSVGNITPAFASSESSEALDVNITQPYVEMQSDIVYCQRFGMENTALKMDVLKPNSEGRHPAVVFVSGGGFVGAPKSNYVQQRTKIAEAGYVVASIEYRTLPFATMPEPVEDVKSAIRYLRANADVFGIDKDNIAVMGESAGGYFSAFTGITNGDEEFDKGNDLDESSSVKAVVDLYGLSDLTKVADDYSDEVKKSHESPAATEAMVVNGLPLFGRGGSIKDNPEAAEKANPISYISKGKDIPSFLIMHGDKDQMVSPSQTEMLLKALVADGVDSTRYVVKNAQHGGEYWAQPEILDIIIQFLDKNLK